MSQSFSAFTKMSQSFSAFTIHKAGSSQWWKAHWLTNITLSCCHGFAFDSQKRTQASSILPRKAVIPLVLAAAVLVNLHCFCIDLCYSYYEALPVMAGKEYTITTGLHCVPGLSSTTVFARYIAANDVQYPAAS